MIQFLIGLFLGTNISLFLYACILAGKNTDKNFIEMEKDSE